MQVQPFRDSLKGPAHISVWCQASTKHSKTHKRQEKQTQDDQEEQKDWWEHGDDTEASISFNTSEFPADRETQTWTLRHKREQLQQC